MEGSQISTSIARFRFHAVRIAIHPTSASQTTEGLSVGQSLFITLAGVEKKKSLAADKAWKFQLTPQAATSHRTYTRATAIAIAVQVLLEASEGKVRSVSFKR